MLKEQEQLRFMRLWTAAQPAVSGYVRSLVRDRAVADEVLQETSLVLFRRFEEYDEQRPFVAWALGIARFQVLSLNRDAGAVVSRLIPICWFDSPRHGANWHRERPTDRSFCRTASSDWRLGRGRWCDCVTTTS